MAHPRQCHAKSKRSGVQCKKYAIKGKDVCRAHGGATPIKHGLYSKYVRGTLGDRIDEAERDPKLLDLRRQVAIAQALQTRKLEALDKMDTIADEELETARKLTDSVTKAIERYQKVQSQPENMVPLELMGELIDLFAGTINRYVQSRDARKAILDAIDSGLRLPTPAAIH